MPSLNKFFCIGNLTRTPELRTTPQGVAVADFGVAINDRWTDKQGEVHEDTTFVDVTVWRGQAESCARYLQKGRQVHIEGRLKLETWQDKATGDKRSKLKVEAESVTFLGSPKGQDADKEQDGIPY